MIETVSLKIFRNVRVDQPDLAAARVGIGFRNRRLAETQRFDFGAGQRDAGLKGLVDEIIETRLANVGNDAQLAFSFRRHAPLNGS
jgi:hypothetical protein